MWKKAFVLLLSLNLLIVVALGLWLGTLPTKVASISPLPTSQGAPIQLSIGQDAINTYLSYALTEQADVKKVLSYAKIGFQNQWDLQLGIKLINRIVPCDVEISPSIHNGNLWLQVTSATIGDIPIPPSALFLIFKHLPWPHWIGVDATQHILQINFTERPQHPYGVSVLNYSAQAKRLTLQVTIAPQAFNKASSSH